nr:hypothetical protein [Tanacetum cinerariifolium]
MMSSKLNFRKKGFAIATLKNELRKISGNSVNTKFAKQSILGKPVLQLHKNQSVVRQPTAFKSERPRISKPQFSSQVDVNNDLSKPVTTHYLPKGKESACAKPHHMIAPGSSRYISNDIVHNHYLEEAKKRHKKANEVNSHAKVPSNKRTHRNKPIEHISFENKPERQIPKGHRFSIKKTSVMHEKTITPRSCLGWKPTGKIFKYVGLRWVPTRKIFTSSTNKVDSELTNGSNNDITNQYECKQTLDVNAELRIHDHNNESSSSKLVPKVVPPAN